MEEMKDERFYSEDFDCDAVEGIIYHCAAVAIK